MQPLVLVAANPRTGPNARPGGGVGRPGGPSRPPEGNPQKGPNMCWAQTKSKSVWPENDPTSFGKVHRAYIGELWACSDPLSASKRRTLAPFLSHLGLCGAGSSANWRYPKMANSGPHNGAPLAWSVPQHTKYAQRTWLPNMQNVVNVTIIHGRTHGEIHGALKLWHNP